MSETTTKERQKRMKKMIAVLRNCLESAAVNFGGLTPEAAKAFSAVMLCPDGHPEVVAFRQRQELKRRMSRHQ